MKKTLLLIFATLTFCFTAHATVVECNPGTNNLAWYLTQGDTLVLADGLYEEAYEIAFNTPGVYVKAAEGAKPVISLTQKGTDFQLKASVTFDGITFDGNNVAEFIATFSEVSVEQISFVNCEFKNYTKYAISDGWYDGCHIGSLLIDNCIFHDGGSAVSIGQLGYDGKVPFDSFKLTNSTIYNVKMSDYAGIVNIFALGEGETEEGEVVIDHVTIYNFDASQLGAISVRKNKNLKISNSIIATPEDKGQRALYVYNGTVDNTLYYNASKRSGNTVYTNCINEDPLFVNAANGNFALAEGSPALGAGTDGSNLGDPRWNAPAVEEPEGVKYELNGGELPEVKVPTNEELALAFKQEYAEYFAIEGLTDIDMKREVGNFIYVTNGKGGDAVKFITENANWKWLYDYILTVAGNIPEGTNVGYYWRANLDGFFHCKNAVAVGGVASADYTEAGKPEAWGTAYQAAHAVVLPTEPVDAPYTLPTPVKEGYKFVGWYDNAEGTGDAYSVIPAGWSGTLYAIWEVPGPTTALENIAVEGKAVKTIINGQLIIIKNGVQYTALGQVIK